MPPFKSFVSRRLRRWPGVLLSGLLLSLPVAASELNASRAELEEIRDSVEQAQRQLAQTDTRRSEARQQLEEAERALADTHQRLQELNTQRDELNDALAQLETRQQSLNTQFEAQRAALAEQIRALYKLGEQPRLKLLLSDQDPAAIDRYQRYLNRLNEARTQQLQRLRELAAALQQNRRDIATRQARLEEVGTELNERQSRLAEQRRTREQALTALDQRYSEGQSRLDGLQSDRAEAQQLVERLERELAARRERERRERERREQARLEQQRQEQARREAEAQRQAQNQLSDEEMNISASDSDERIAVSEPPASSSTASPPPASAPPVTHRASGSGSSRWPVAGRMISAYGQGEGLNRNGVMIAASAGTPVHAAAAGQVVFADWMRGFGYLVIIDHGGVLSLYAHQQRLTVAEGDRVERGAVLGYVGDSGGLSRPALYFEVRRAGNTINPDGWLAAR
ncbi:murein hydrolase activator EnvC family protein [Kushneria aurantia]|uniref:Murein hydrolase activator EnvC family protein n=1 Tax=Kushneria aurantia TaxID=504092 RepID=A0ABV6G1H5_9GAMM|nr:peptidoglycan DD-metalloendopeptidase family protein [Kushneria aurantia]